MDCDKSEYNFLTVYKKDYVQKPVKLYRKNSQQQEFPDPITEGFKKYLVLDNSNVEAPNEDGEIYLEKFKQRHRTIGDRYFKDPMNKELIFRNKITKGMATEYQTNYCDIEKDIQYYLEKRNHKDMICSDAKLPETTYTKYFRNPNEFLSRHCEKRTIIRQRDNLETKGSLICNNISEYNDNIGRLGGVITKENMTGRNLFEVDETT